MMEALYWVLTWACHRKCRHCYDDRFRPYVRGELTRVVDEGARAAPHILANLPDDLSFRDEGGRRRRTRLVLAGGELLLDSTREPLLWPVLDGIRRRWPDRPPHVSIQTTGDVLTEDIVRELLARGVGTIAIGSVDDHHVGMEGKRRFAFMDEIRALMARCGVREVPPHGALDARLAPGHAPNPAPEADAPPRGPTFLFFGAQPELWIGELWPRGRAFANGLSRATWETKFCSRWSGGRNFLELGRAGSEVAIEPDGSVYPCCLKTAAPLGNLTEERLEDMLADLAQVPALQAINRGDPVAMGAQFGITPDGFRALARARDGTGRMIETECLGCDAVFRDHLGPLLAARRAARLSRQVLSRRPQADVSPT